MRIFHSNARLEKLSLLLYPKWSRKRHASIHSLRPAGWPKDRLTEHDGEQRGQRVKDRIKGWLGV